MSDAKKDDRDGAEKARAETRAKQRPGTPDETDSAASSTPLTQQVGRAVLLLIAVLFLAFSLVNRQPVAVDWVVTQTATPLILLLVGAFVLGLLVGAGLFWRRVRHRRNASAPD